MQAWKPRPVLAPVTIATLLERLVSLGSAKGLVQSWDLRNMAPRLELLGSISRDLEIAMLVVDC